MLSTSVAQTLVKNVHVIVDELISSLLKRAYYKEHINSSKIAKFGREMLQNA